MAVLKIPLNCYLHDSICFSLTVQMIVLSLCLSFLKEEGDRFHDRPPLEIVIRKFRSAKITAYIAGECRGRRTKRVRSKYSLAYRDLKVSKQDSKVREVGDLSSSRIGGKLR